MVPYDTAARPKVLQVISNTSTSPDVTGELNTTLYKNLY